MSSAQGSGAIGIGGGFLSSLYKRGVRLWAEDGRLRFQAPKGALASEDLDKLRAFRAEIIELIGQMEFASNIPLQPRPAGCQVPLTATQLLAWNGIQKSDEKLSIRFCTIGVRIFGPLNAQLLKESIDALVRRHESLRTRIVALEGTPVQQVDPAAGGQLQLVDFGAVSAAHVEEDVGRLAQEFIDEKVDLAVGPVFAAKLFRLSDNEHVLILAIEHLFCDGVSMEILGREVWALYDRAIRGLPLVLPQLPVQFADYAVWQQKTYDVWEETHATYWKEHLQGAPCLRLPRDEGLVEAKNPTGTVFQLLLENSLSVRLREVARRERTLPALVLLTIYVAVMSRWHEQGDLVVGFASNGRYRPELRDMVGLLVDGMHLRIKVSEDDTFLHLLGRVKEEFQHACEHPQFGHVQDIIIPEGSSDFSLSFNWQPTSWMLWFASGGWQFNDQIRVQSFPLNRVWVAEFHPLFYDTGEGIGLAVTYRQDFLRAATVERFASELRSFAAKCAEDVFARVASISMKRA